MKENEELEFIREDAFVHKTETKRRKKEKIHEIYRIRREK